MKRKVSSIENSNTRFFSNIFHRINNNSAILDESIDVDRMVKVFDIENFREIVEISSISAILGSDCVENSSEEQFSRISNPPAVFTDISVTKNLIDIEEQTDIIDPDFSQPTDIRLKTDTIEETPDCFGNSNSHSVENSADEFDHQNNELANNHKNVDANKSDEENTYNNEQMMEETEFDGISISEFDISKIWFVST